MTYRSIDGQEQFDYFTLAFQWPRTFYKSKNASISVVFTNLMKLKIILLQYFNFKRNIITFLTIFGIPMKQQIKTSYWRSISAYYSMIIIHPFEKVMYQGTSFICTVFY